MFRLRLWRGVYIDTMLCFTVKENDINHILLSKLDYLHIYGALFSKYKGRNRELELIERRKKNLKLRKICKKKEEKILSGKYTLA